MSREEGGGVSNSYREQRSCRYTIGASGRWWCRPIKLMSGPKGVRLAKVS